MNDDFNHFFFSIFNFCLFLIMDNALLYTSITFSLILAAGIAVSVFFNLHKLSNINLEDILVTSDDYRDARKFMVDNFGEDWGFVCRIAFYILIFHDFILFRFYCVELLIDVLFSRIWSVSKARIWWSKRICTNYSWLMRKSWTSHLQIQKQSIFLQIPSYSNEWIESHSLIRISAWKSTTTSASFKYVFFFFHRQYSSSLLCSSGPSTGKHSKTMWTAESLPLVQVKTFPVLMEIQFPLKYFPHRFEQRSSCLLSMEKM